jgi:hypothetical protein
MVRSMASTSGRGRLILNFIYWSCSSSSSSSSYYTYYFTSYFFTDYSFFSDLVYFFDTYLYILAYFFPCFLFPFKNLAYSYSQKRSLLVYCFFFLWGLKHHFSIASLTKNYKN